MARPAVRIAVRPRGGESSSRLPAGPGSGTGPWPPDGRRGPPPLCPRTDAAYRGVLPVRAPKARETAEPRSACGGPRGRAGPPLRGTGALAAVRAPPPCLARGNGPPPPPWLRREETSSSILWDLLGELGAHQHRTPWGRETWPGTAPTALDHRPCARLLRACAPRLRRGRTTVRGPGAAAGSRRPPSGLAPRVGAVRARPSVPGRARAPGPARRPCSTLTGPRATARPSLLLPAVGSDPRPGAPPGAFGAEPRGGGGGTRVFCSSSTPTSSACVMVPDFQDSRKDLK